MFKAINKYTGYRNTLSTQNYVHLFPSVEQGYKRIKLLKKKNLPLLETRPGLLFSRSHDAPIRSNTDFEELKPKNQYTFNYFNKFI